MRCTYQLRQTIVRVYVDCDHQVEPQQRQVSQVVLSQSFAPEVSVHAAQTAKPINRRAHAFEIRQLNAPVVANHYVFNMSTAIDQRADLSACFM